MRIAITGGKTGGHVFPALAVAESLREYLSGSRSYRSGGVETGSPGMVDLLFLGLAGGIEDQAVPAAGIPLMTLKLTSPDSFANRARFARDDARALVECWRKFRTFRPDVLFSTGGFVSLAPTVAAWLRRVPIVVYLPDVYPGKTVNATRRLARAVAVTSEQTLSYVGHRSVHVTGYPVRSDFLRTTRVEARSSLGLGAEDLQVIVMGGSQGSAAINQAVVELLPEILPLARVLHVCGPRNLDGLARAAESIPESLRHRYRLEPMLEGKSMAEAMFASDVAVTRAGASILGELPAAGLPAIVVPLPINAQDINAATLAAEHACVVVEQGRLGSGELKRELLSLLHDDDRRAALRMQLARLRRPDAAASIADLLFQVGGRVA